MSGRLKAVAALLLSLWILSGCQRASEISSANRLVFVYQPLGGQAGALEGLLDEFRRAHPDVELVPQLLPNASDVAHQYFLTTLEGGSTDIDVFVVDVVWVSEFAKAGWILDLTQTFPPEEMRKEFLPGPAEAVMWEDRVYAVPWYLDVGLLYYRTDLVPRAPKTYAELISFAQEAMKKNPSLRGYVWQGKQYEGLVCNVYETIWGHGGQSLTPEGRLDLSSPPAQKALQYLHSLLQTKVSPASVTSAAEEEARRTFQNGGAVFMRNWPYAWAEAQTQGSPVRGRVEVAPLPTLDGSPGHGTLGGWQLAINAHLPPDRRARAVELVRHLSTAEANLKMALSYGRNPPRRAVYEAEDLQERQPFIAKLRPIFEQARPRPVTPYYSLLSDVLQSEFSAAVTGVRTPEKSLRWAQKRADQLMGLTSHRESGP